MGYSRPTIEAAYLAANAQAEIAHRATGAMLLLFLCWYVPCAAAGLLAWWAHPLLWLGFVSLVGAVKEPARATLKKADALAETARASQPHHPHAPPSLN